MKSMQEKLNRNAFCADRRLEKAKKRLERSQAWFALQGLDDPNRWAKMEADIDQLTERANYWRTLARDYQAGKRRDEQWKGHTNAQP